jgi:phage gp16-like protein
VNKVARTIEGDGTFNRLNRKKTKEIAIKMSSEEVSLDEFKKHLEILKKIKGERIYTKPSVDDPGNDKCITA